jgi:hypothetical protein
MKRLAAIFFLVLFLFNTMGYYFVYTCNQVMLHAEMKSLIRAGCYRDKYVLLKIKDPASNRDFTRVDQSEFRYMGNLYDEIRQEQQGNYTWFYCINDSQEERLITNYEKYQKQEPGSSFPARGKNIQAMMHHLILQALVSGVTKSELPSYTSTKFCNRLFSSHSVYLLPVTPPPELA